MSLSTIISAWGVEKPFTTLRKQLKLAMTPCWKDSLLMAFSWCLYSRMKVIKLAKLTR
jgi:hypothetical protein